MSIIEKLEITLMSVFIALTSLFAVLFPSLFISEISLGQLMLYCAAFLLLQGLIRDLYVYFSIRKTKQALKPLHTPKSSQEPKPLVKSKATCICLESSVGVLVILCGALMILTRLDVLITVSPWQWVAILSLIVIAGFVLKDWVLHWQPIKLAREKNHANVIFTIKK